jgi:hypothetical protein
MNWQAPAVEQRLALFKLIASKSATIAPAVGLLVALLEPWYPHWAAVPYLGTGLILCAILGLLLMGTEVWGIVSRKPFTKELFAGPGEPEAKFSWKRPAELTELSGLIDKSNVRSLVVFGPSGVGENPSTVH